MAFFHSRYPSCAKYAEPRFLHKALIQIVLQSCFTPSLQAVVKARGWDRRCVNAMWLTYSCSPRWLLSCSSSMAGVLSLPLPLSLSFFVFFSFLILSLVFLPLSRKRWKFILGPLLLISSSQGISRRRSLSLNFILAAVKTKTPFLFMLGMVIL